MTKKTEEPPVLCVYDKLVPLDELRVNPRNPSAHSDEQIRLLGKLIRHHGWRVPITVSNQSGLIVRGHGRYLAAQAEGFTLIPVDYQDYPSEEDEYADLVADNRIAELAVVDAAMLKDLLEELDSGDYDMELTGYTEDALERMMTEIHRPDPLPDLDIEGWGELNRRVIIVFENDAEFGEFWDVIGASPNVLDQVVYAWADLRGQ